jgi:beta-galactosidase
MRTVLSINDAWRYSPDFSEASIGFRDYPAHWESVALPHANKELPLNGFDETEYQFVSSYFRQVNIPCDGRHFLDFEGVMCACDVWVNGERAGGHKGGYTPFSVEITEFAAPGTTASVLVRVDSTERKDIPPFGFVVDYLAYGGIYREVSFRSQTGDFVETVFARPDRVTETEKTVAIEIAINRARQNAAPENGDARAKPNERATKAICEIFDGTRIAGRAESDIDPMTDACALKIDGIAGIRLWDIDDPALYRLRVTLADASGATIDAYEERIGFRTARFEPDGFYLNGKRRKIVGLNRHQSWPYVGYAMPARAQKRDAEILRNELGVNLVRTSHYPQSRHFLDACDELGLLVFEEMPGWQHIGDAEWQDNECEAIREMIVRDRNRPSIVLWGVRVNESADSHDFYARTNALARKLDPTRQTGGVRVIERSRLLEDVYTFNDFNYSGETDGFPRLKKPRDVTGLMKVPYLVTEFNGHMFPTKSFDGEERLTEHALRHAAVLDAAFANRAISGAIGWCAFDYNTHRDFGSGDRVCYHGVMDMFREPKYAAFAYASQAEPSRRIVMEAATLFSKGDRSAARLLPVEVWTNCDSIILWREGKRVGEFFPDRKNFPHLPHPPIVIGDIIGEQLDEEGFSEGDSALIRKIAGVVFAKNIGAVSLGDKIRAVSLALRNRLSLGELAGIVTKYAIGWGRENERFRLEGIIAGKTVIERTYGGDACATSLEVKPDDDILAAGDWDTTRIAVRALDQYGNKNPYVAEALSISVEGPAKLIGPALVPLVGGGTAFWIRTTGKAGMVKITVTGGRFGPVATDIRIAER